MIKKPYAWVAIGMRDGDGDPLSDCIRWTKAEAVYVATTYLNGLKRDRPGYVKELFLGEDVVSGSISK